MCLVYTKYVYVRCFNYYAHVISHEVYAAYWHLHFFYIKCMHLHSYALMPAPFMHIDPAIEKETVQEQPLIEEPAEEQENQQLTTDPAAE